MTQSQHGTPAKHGTIFSQDTIATLLSLVPLANSELGGTDVLADSDALGAFLDEHGWTGRRDGDDAELGAMRALRVRVRALWELLDQEEALVDEVNALLVATKANPWLTRHPEAPYWHLHFNRTDDPLAVRIGADIAMTFAELIRADETSRLKRCAAPDCSAVLVDLSKNRSRMFCDIGNCGNKQHAAAYRARKARAL
ncbi:MAG: CGNR zinc finger domain-containing protein [Segniliparus sp.]|uniref:CGNR zinc finger domain-containing protein n=1 Tax=Segniliparus sp. TaxID=2804064 RepID=UPI003F3FB85F